MKRKSNYLLMVCIIVLINCKSDDSLNPRDDHFEFILYDNLNASTTSPIHENLMTNYNRITSDLKVVSMPRVIIKIWGNEDNFLDVMERDIGTRYPGSTGYIFGSAEMRLLHTVNVSQTAVHEFAHIVSLQVNNNFGNNPRWLWEAVAIYESNEFVDPKSLSYIVSGNYPTISELNSNFNSSKKIYSVGYVLVEYVVQTWGIDDVIELIKSYGNIQSVLGIPVQEFEQCWYQFLEERYL